MDKIKLAVVAGGIVIFSINWLLGNKLFKWYKSLQKTAKWIVSGITIAFFIISFIKNPSSYSTTDILSSFMDGRIPDGLAKNNDENNIGDVLMKPIVDKGKKVKRNVNGYTKRLVGHNQNWLCKKCNNKLDPMFETDHIIPLYQGGTNDVNNLQALCRNCHGKKTMMDAIKVE